MENIAQQLKDTRVKNGYTQNEVATILCITRQSISKWENGRTYLDLDNLVLLSDLYKTPLDDLVRKNKELQTNTESIKKKRKS
ncbi:helix-turn-helix domain-containing protein [Dellaglioa sp. L3N]